MSRADGFTRALALATLLGLGGGAWADESLPGGPVEATAPPSAEPLNVDVSPDAGVEIQGEHGATWLHIGGTLAVDGYSYDDRNTRPSQIEVHHARIRLEGRPLEWLLFRLTADLIGIDTEHGLEEGWVALEPDPLLRLSAGLLRVPLGIESSFRMETLPFVGYGYAVFLDTRTDIGVRVEGELMDGLLSWDLAALAGEGFDPHGEPLDGPRLSGRLVAYPLRWLDLTVSPFGIDIPVLSGIFLHGAYAWSPRWEGRLEISTPLRNKVFTTPRFRAGVTMQRSFGYGWDLGPLRITHELVRGGFDDVRASGGQRVDLDDQVTAWQLTVSAFLTGERYDSRPLHQGPTRPEDFPRRPLFSKDRPTGPGAIEVAVRYANADIDRRFFETDAQDFGIGLTTFDVSSQESRTFAAAASWYPTRSLRATFEVVRVIADQRPAAFDSHGRDTSFVLRVQVAF